MQSRESKGLEIAKHASIEEMEDGSFSVPSQSDKAVSYAVKVQRGWKNPASKIAEGQRIHYNVVKPHQALDGQTPAQFARIGVEGNKWLSLMSRPRQPE